MSVSSHDLGSLFNRLLEGELSPRETEILIEWLGSDKPDPLAGQLILQQLEKSAGENQVNPGIIASLELKIPAMLEEAKNRHAQRARILKFRWLRYAAIIVVCFGIAISLLLINRSSRQTANNNKNSTSPKIDINPGSEGAILTLDDGRTVVLDSLGNGVIATQQGAEVTLDNGLVSYKGNKINGGTAYNTMSTPKGRQFRLKLQDGTEVWLNAASSIRYPIAFTGAERKVEVTGEVYFEVAKNTKMPFRVKVNNETDIEVLGTHFNINSYKNETAVKTTLLEGSLRIINKNEKAVLKPGQQAQVAVGTVQRQDDKKQDRIKVVSGVDVQKVMAWKNGVFNFEDATLEEVMRQLERWYDIEVVYEGGVPDIEFMGKMGRDLTLSEVLRGLEISKVHFRIEGGRRLIVMP